MTAEIFDWESIKESAFVLPELTKETMLDVDNGGHFKSFIVLPARSTWEDIG